MDSRGFLNVMMGTPQTQRERYTFHKKSNLCDVSDPFDFTFRYSFKAEQLSQFKDIISKRAKDLEVAERKELQWKLEVSLKDLVFMFCAFNTMVYC